MPVDLLRWIDYWIGLPLCWLLTPVAWIKKGWLLLKPQAPRPVKKVLIIKLSELGALVLASPSFRAIKQRYPESDVYVLTFARNRHVFSLMDDLIDSQHIVAIKDGSWQEMVMSLLSLVGTLYQARFDVVIDLEFFSRVGALLTFVSRAPIAVGFHAYGFEGLYRGNFLTHRVMYNPLAHVSVNYMSLVNALSQPTKSSPQIDCSYDEKTFTFACYKPDASVALRLERFNLPEDKKIFLLNAGEGVLSLREWPMANFIAIIQHILKDPHHVVVLVGTQSAQEKADQIMAQVKHPHLHDLSGKTSLSELMEIFLRSHMLIANDGGIVHLAMMTPIHKMVFFGPESPQIFGPIGANTHIFYSQWPCSPCLSVLSHRHSACQDNHCLKAITVNQVITRIEQVSNE